jgi:hypothetical protein
VISVQLCVLIAALEELVAAVGQDVAGAVEVAQREQHVARAAGASLGPEAQRSACHRRSAAQATLLDGVLQHDSRIEGR